MRIYCGQCKFIHLSHIQLHTKNIFTLINDSMSVIDPLCRMEGGVLCENHWNMIRIWWQMKETTNAVMKCQFVVTRITFEFKQILKKNRISFRVPFVLDRLIREKFQNFDTKISDVKSISCMRCVPYVIPHFKRAILPMRCEILVKN